MRAANLVICAAVILAIGACSSAPTAVSVAATEGVPLRLSAGTAAAASPMTEADVEEGPVDEPLEVQGLTSETGDTTATTRGGLVFGSGN